jgi:uncharacterized protein (DUF433 family)
MIGTLQTKVFGYCASHYGLTTQPWLARRWAVWRKTMDECQTRIVVDPEILVGKPIIKGTRLAVEFILELLAEGWSEAEILRNYPGLTQEDIRACLAYASSMGRSYVR